MKPEMLYYNFSEVWSCYFFGMLLLYTNYVYVTLLSHIYYTSTKTELLHSFYSYSIILRFYYDSINDYGTKELIK